MSEAAEWSAMPPYAPDPHEDVHAAGTRSVTNLSWSQQQQTMSHAPAFGGRRQWCGYSFELTGYGAVELCGPLAYRVTIVHSDAPQALHQLHRLVSSGRLQPAWYRRKLDASCLHVVDRAELSGTRVDARGSWLFVAQAVARLCRTDDGVAQIAGPALRRLLWTERGCLDTAHFAAAINELHRATADLAAERKRYLVALEQKILSGDVESIRLEAQVLAEVRREWDADRARPARQ